MCLSLRFLNTGKESSSPESSRTRMCMFSGDYLALFGEEVVFPRDITGCPVHVSYCLVGLSLDAVPVRICFAYMRWSNHEKCVCVCVCVFVCVYVYIYGRCENVHRFLNVFEHSEPIVFQNESCYRPIQLLHIRMLCHDLPHVKNRSRENTRSVYLFYKSNGPRQRDLITLMMFLVLIFLLF